MPEANTSTAVSSLMVVRDAVHVLLHLAPAHPVEMTELAPGFQEMANSLSQLVAMLRADSLRQQKGEGA